MSGWAKVAISDYTLLRKNIQDLGRLKEQLHHLSRFATLSHSGAFNVISNLVEDKIVKSIPTVKQLLDQAYMGDHHQKVALDAPQRFAVLIEEAEFAVEREIVKKGKELKEMTDRKG